MISNYELFVLLFQRARVGKLHYIRIVRHWCINFFFPLAVFKQYQQLIVYIMILHLQTTDNVIKYRGISRYDLPGLLIVLLLDSQVPGSKSKLMISLVPVDVGQPTVRLGKAAVQDGICTWENPVYETVKFTRETKTGKLHDKIYQLIISTVGKYSAFLSFVAFSSICIKNFC